MNFVRRTALPFAANARLRGWALSLIFGLAVVGSFYLLQWIIPPSAYYNETVTVLFIVISILLLFPAREQLLKNFLKRSDYAALFGGDLHHVDFMARPFTLYSLVHEVLPELLNWLGLSSGRLAVLDAGRRSFSFYSFRRGHVIRSRRLRMKSGDELARILKQQRSVVTAENAPPNIQPVLRSLRAAEIHPVLYRARLLGFLVLPSPPRNRFASRALDLFCGKAAVSIQNEFITDRIMDAASYEEEFASADKIRGLLSATRIPDVPGYQIERMAADKHSALIEFIETQDGRWFLAALTLPSGSSRSGLVLAGMLGQLYSLVLREKEITVNRIARVLEAGEELLGSEEVDLLIAEFEVKANTLIVVVDGKDYRVRMLGEHEPLLISSGWRNFVRIDPGRTLRIEYGQEALLEITRKPVEASA